MALNPLASAIYDILRPMLPSPTAEISYSDLVAQLGHLPTPNQGLQPRDLRLDEALGELVTVCRQQCLPAISAMVVRSEDRIPGNGYYRIAHPTAGANQAVAMRDWGLELIQVRQTTYPPSL